MQTPKTRHGLRVSVRLHELTVGETVYWGGRKDVVVGNSPADAIPTAGGVGLVRARWLNPKKVQLFPLANEDEPVTLTPGQQWFWENGRGVAVTIDLVPRIPARKRPHNAGGDVALLTLMLMMMVGVTQLQLVLNAVFPDRGVVVDNRFEPSPELIARLLERDFDGAEEGLGERVDRPDMRSRGDSFFMPAGNQGVMNRSMGGEQTGEEVNRTDETESEESPETDSTANEADELLGSPPQPVMDEEETAKALAGAHSLSEPAERVLPTAVERFIGWGFKDWFAVTDARGEEARKMARHLELTREKLAIDPDHPGAIMVVGYYAYLSEEPEMGREVYERFSELYPDDPAGYNNLALTYKRTGDYEMEEALYRKALALSPQDPLVLNNLAVNLAHQGRTQDALEIMELVEQYQPDDPYADLHRSKIYALMGKRERAYANLRRALEGSRGLDTFHHIEFRQDLRLDPAFDDMRTERRFARLLRKFYQEDAEYLLLGSRKSETKGGHRG